MEENKMKNIIVLKNLPSNLVEEAIVVLRENKTKLPEHIKKCEQKNNVKVNEKDYILKEAEMVVSNYLSNIESNKIVNKKKTKEIEKKYHRLQFVSIGLFITLIFVMLLN